MSRVSVIGLGKLGSPMAAFYASRGHDVVGYDASPRIAQKLAWHVAPVEEPGLQEMITQNSARLSVAASVADAVASTEISFIIVPTPSDDRGAFSLEFILEAVREVGEAIAAKGYHIVVITSTVMPGDTDSRIQQALERTSGKACGSGFGLCYSPEFIALGSVLHDLAGPDFVLLGQSDSVAGDVLAAFYNSLFDEPRSITRMTNVNAELAKIAVNTYVTTKIAFANMIASICEKLPNADAATVTAAVGLDKRIGRRYLNAGAPYGGPCFPRDNRALLRVARDAGVDAEIAAATDAVNVRWLGEICGKVLAAGNAENPVAVLGLSYKPGTPVITESPGMMLADMLAAAGRHVVVYDPLAMDAARIELGDRVEYAESFASALGSAEVVVSMTAWPEFSTASPSDLRNRGVGVTIIDCWGGLAASLASSEAQIVRLGVSKS